jgi:transcriptional regulator with XRE-family HTH domain
MVLIEFTRHLRRYTKLTPELTDPAVLRELGERLARQRIDAGLSQAALAEQAAVAKRTVERIEAGHGSELATLIRILRILKLLDGLDALVPELPPSPVAELRRRDKPRRRVARRSGAAAKPWHWRE